MGRSPNFSKTGTFKNFDVLIAVREHAAAAKLSLGQRQVLHALVMRAAEKHRPEQGNQRERFPGVSFPSTAKLREDTGMSRRGIQKALRALEKAGIITTYDVYGETSNYDCNGVVAALTAASRTGVVKPNTSELSAPVDKGSRGELSSPGGRTEFAGGGAN